MFTRYLLPVVSVVAVAFAVIQMTKAQQKPPPAAPPVEPASSPFASQLAGAGIVEPETENIAIGSHVPGVVDRVYAKVGETVLPGRPLFRLDDRHLKAELGVRKANLAGAGASREKLERMPREEEVPPLEAKVREAQANLDDQQQQYDRVQKLAASVSAEERSRRRLAVEIAEAQLAKARADLALLQKGAWEFDKLVSEAAVKQAEAAVRQTETELDRLVVRAPRMRWPEGADPPFSLADRDTTEFKVLQVNVRPGEYVGTVPGQAMVVLGHVGRLHVRVDVDENEIGRFRPGLPGVAKPRGSPDQEFPLTFVRVEPYVIPKKSLTGANTERVDTRVLQVIYAVETRGRPLFVGQQMDVFLNTDGR